METSKRQTAAFTGHRSFKMAAGGNSLFAPSPVDPVTLRNRLSETLEGLCREGYTTFLCGMAEGFDLLAAETVLALRGQYPDTRLVAVVPYPGQARGFDPATRQRYDDALSQAAEVITLSDRYTPDCFHRRNDYLTDHCSVLVAFYNGTPGGTAYTVRRARQQGIRLLNLAALQA